MLLTNQDHDDGGGGTLCSSARFFAKRSCGPRAITYTVFSIIVTVNETSHCRTGKRIFVLARNQPKPWFMFSYDYDDWHYICDKCNFAV
jgi:hypothetical protein